MTDTGPVPPVGRNGRENVRTAAEMAAMRPTGVVDHTERARVRMAELRATMGDFDEYSDVHVDKWHFEAPPGWSYEWKTWSVWNKEFPQYLNGLQGSGWSYVEASRHRDRLYPEYENEKIILDGMVLMERPKELTDRARMREERRAREWVANSEAKLSDAPSGTAPRDAHPKTRPRLSASVGPVIPD